MKATGGRYAYAYEPSGKLMSALGATSYPSAALIDPSGTVVWTGHPGALEPKMISEFIKGAFKKPIWEWPKSTKSIVKALKAKQFAKALAALAKLKGTDDSIEGIRASVEALIAGRMKSLENAYKNGDYLGALSLADDMKAEMKGIDANYARVKELKDLIQADKQAKRVIKFQKKLLDLKEERLNTRKDIKEMIKLAEELSEEAAGTYAAEQAGIFVKQLEKKLR